MFVIGLFIFKRFYLTGHQKCNVMVKTNKKKKKVTQMLHFTSIYYRNFIFIYWSWLKLMLLLKKKCLSTTKFSCPGSARRTNQFFQSIIQPNFRFSRAYFLKDLYWFFWFSQKKRYLILKKFCCRQLTGKGNLCMNNVNWLKKLLSQNPNVC